MKTIEITLDPLKKHPTVGGEIAFLMRGLPDWLGSYDAEREERPLHEYMRDCYYCDAKPVTGGRVTLQGVYKPLAAPDQYPLAWLRCGGKTVIVYKHQLTAIIEDNTRPPTGDNVTVYRFD